MKRNIATLLASVLTASILLGNEVEKAEPNVSILGMKAGMPVSEIFNNEQLKKITAFDDKMTPVKLLEEFEKNKAVYHTEKASEKLTERYNWIQYSAKMKAEEAPQILGLPIKSFYFLAEYNPETNDYHIVKASVYIPVAKGSSAVKTQEAVSTALIQQFPNPTYNEENGTAWRNFGPKNLLFFTSTYDEQTILIEFDAQTHKGEYIQKQRARAKQIEDAKAAPTVKPGLE